MAHLRKMALKFFMHTLQIIFYSFLFSEKLSIWQKFLFRHFGVRNKSHKD